MILVGMEMVEAFMHINNGGRQTDANGKEVIVVAYHDGERYAFKTDAQAHFVFGKMGWGEPKIEHVSLEENT